MNKTKTRFPLSTDAGKQHSFIGHITGAAAGERQRGRPHEQQRCCVQEAIPRGHSLHGMHYIDLAEGLDGHHAASSRCMVRSFALSRDVDLACDDDGVLNTMRRCELTTTFRFVPLLSFNSRRITLHSCPCLRLSGSSRAATTRFTSTANCDARPT